MSRFILWPRALITALILAAATPLCWSAAQSPRGRSASTNAPFTLAKRAGGWSLVSPQGQPFFSVGVCVVSQGAERSVYDAENPGYAAWRHYADANAWAETTLRRLKLWRFTTLGGWSDDEALRRAKGSSLWLTPVLHIGATAGAPWWDMWDAKIVRRMEEQAREQILAVRDDPRLIGYYSDNELGWWNSALWKMTLEQPSSSGQRQRLIQLLRDTYGKDWTRLLRDFDVEKAENWRELQRGGTLWLKPGGEGIKVMRRFLGLLADRYYQLVHDLIRKHDSRALILGDRYQSFYYPEVARAAARWVDAISSNLNANWDDGTFLRCHLDTLHALTGKPVFVSEVYMAAQENGSGNKNNHGVFPTVMTQGERAQSIRNTLTALARLPQVVGVDWFQFFDEPRHGRHDGENYNFGLVDIHDQPYPEVTSVFASFDPVGIRSQSAAPRPDASLGLPPAPRDPLDGFTGTHAMSRWDRERGFVKPVTPFPVGDLYVCWNSNALYLGLQALDIVEDAYYRDQSVPKNDRAQWLVEVTGGKAVRVRLGAGREAIPSDAGVRVEHLPSLNLKVRNVAAMELTAAQIGRRKLQAGDTIEFSSTLWTHCQAYQVQWKGKFKLTD